MRSVRIFNAHPQHRRRHNETIRIVRNVLKGEKCPDADISVIFNNDRQMMNLNSLFLHRKNTTDVISFSLDEGRRAGVVGEVYVNIDQAQRQAKSYDVSLSNELARLTIHGVLHLLNYDDKTRAQKTEMTRLEDRYLKSC